MTRQITCYVTNNTSSSIYVNSRDLLHGDWNTSPQTITPNCSSLLIFDADKYTGSVYGTIGSVSYLLDDGSMMLISFSNPFDRDGSGGNDNCWSYAGLSTIPQGGTAYYVNCDVLIDGHPMDPLNPPLGNDVVAKITIGNSK